VPNETIVTAAINTELRSRLVERIEKMNKRAAKLHVAPFELTFGAETIVYKPAGKGIDYVLVDVTISGPRCAVDGWILVAKFDFMGESGGVIVSKSPGFESLAVDREIDAGRCDHCRTIRRRAVSYLVQHGDTGARKVVGSTCLPDFTGLGRDAVAQLELRIAAFEACDDLEGSGGGFRGIDVADFLAVTSAMIRAYGWCSKARANAEGVRSTSELVDHWLGASPKDRREGWPEVVVERSDRAVALRSMHWASQQSGSDYIDNLAVIADARWCTRRHAGLACSMVSAWLRHRGDLKERARRVQVNPDAVVGAAGDKIATYVEIVRSRVFSNDWGSTTQVVMTEVATGAAIIWWASGDTSDIVDGERVQICATVKKLDSYKGTRQTVVTRLSVQRHTCTQPKARKPRAKKAEVFVGAFPRQPYSDPAYATDE
jgi:hypothetical protein